MRRALAAWIVCIAPLLAGCASPPHIGDREQQVRAYFGTPAAERQLPDGSKVLDYSRAPQGQENWRVTLGPDGSVRSVRNLLGEDNFANVTIGMTREQVLEQLGPHGETMSFPRLGEEVLSWRFLSIHKHNMFFNAHFDPSGRLKYATQSEDRYPSMEEM